MKAALLALALAAPPAADARALPGRAQVEAALNAHAACADVTISACHPLVRYRLSRVRCLRLPPDPSHPGRILCHYAGTLRRDRGDFVRLHGECAYLRPGERGGWRVDAYPDADMCA